MSAITETTAAKPGTGSTRRIMKLAQALAATRYVEIGVNNGATFHDIEITSRTAVDPKFLFNPADFTTRSTRFLESTSDAFFEGVPCGEAFDIYFLDGLHTFEQTLRDLCNAIVHSTPQTVWLVDDTKPHDVFSALPDMQRAYRFREMTGNKGRAWHGDVFKLVYYIHDFMPTLNYRTLIGGGNPQTLVWRSNRGWRMPRFNNLETISRMGYFDLYENIDVLRECPEDESIQLCIDEVTALSTP